MSKCGQPAIGARSLTIMNQVVEKRLLMGESEKSTGVDHLLRCFDFVIFHCCVACFLIIKGILFKFLGELRKIFTNLLVNKAS